MKTNDWKLISDHLVVSDAQKYLLLPTCTDGLGKFNGRTLPIESSNMLTLQITCALLNFKYLEFHIMVE